MHPCILRSFLIWFPRAWPARFLDRERESLAIRPQACGPVDKVMEQHVTEQSLSRAPRNVLACHHGAGKGVPATTRTRVFSYCEAAEAEVGTVPRSRAHAFILCKGAQHGGII